MQQKLIFPILLLLFMISTNLVNAQVGDSTDKKKIQLSAGLQFISNQTYAGRTDSLKLPVIIPSFTVKSSSGFFAKMNGYINMSGNNQNFDGISIEPGYEFSKGQWNASFSILKNFINDSSNLIIAPIKTALEFYAGNRNKIINPNLGAEYLFSPEGNDFIVYGGLSKNFLLTAKDKEPAVNIEPSFSLTGGTQTFFYSFIKTYAVNGKKGRGRRNNPPPISQTVATESRKFTLLGVGAEIPVSISAGKFEGKITPAWESPVNLVNSGGAGTQQAKSYVYFTIGLTYNF